MYTSLCCSYELLAVHSVHCGSALMPPQVEETSITYSLCPVLAS